MANTSVAITPGSGANIDAYALASNGDLQQIIRQSTSDTLSGTGTPWTVSTSAANPIAADENRMCMLIYNASTVRVYIAFNSAAAVTAANAGWFLDAGDRMEVPYGLCQLPVSAVAATAGSGTMNFTLGLES